ncbi:MAG TPA: Maf family protein [Rhodocyclaceae bacterium]
MIATNQARIYLASRSPRRRELLHQIGVPFDTLLFRSGRRDDDDVDETPLANEDPVDYVQRLARAKAAFGVELVRERRLIAQPLLAADTTVVFGDEILGKPGSIDEAAAMLGKLSGGTHRVLTAVAVAYGERIEHALSVSEVRFRPLADEEIQRYARSGEPMDKAGAYGIQGRAATFVSHLSGSYTGVMGLPLFETAALLGKFGIAI